MHAQLYSNVHPVRCEPGLLEIHVDGDAPTNLAGRISKHLMDWTGQRWMVLLSDRAGEPTLAENDRVIEKKRQEQVRAHPLMQAVMLHFPEAKMTNLRRKNVAPLGVTDNDTAATGVDDAFATNETTELED